MDRREMQARHKSLGGWGEVGSNDMTRYMKPMPNKRRKCRHEDCPNRATHMGMCNGVALTHGCEWHMRKWVACAT
jgi:hypothetical protein